MRPRRRKPGESIKDYRAMIKRMEERFSGRGSFPMPKHSTLALVPEPWVTIELNLL